MQVHRQSQSSSPSVAEWKGKEEETRTIGKPLNWWRRNHHPVLRINSGSDASEIKISIIKEIYSIKSQFPATRTPPPRLASPRRPGIVKKPLLPPRLVGGGQEELGNSERIVFAQNPDDDVSPATDRGGVGRSSLAGRPHKPINTILKGAIRNSICISLRVFVRIAFSARDATLLRIVSSSARAEGRGHLGSARHCSMTYSDWRCPEVVVVSKHSGRCNTRGVMIHLTNSI